MYGFVSLYPVVPLFLSAHKVLDQKTFFTVSSDQLNLLELKLFTGGFSTYELCIYSFQYLLFCPYLCQK